MCIRDRLSPLLEEGVLLLALLELALLEGPLPQLAVPQTNIAERRKSTPRLPHLVNFIKDSPFRNFHKSNQQPACYLSSLYQRTLFFATVNHFSDCYFLDFGDYQFPQGYQKVPFCRFPPAF